MRHAVIRFMISMAAALGLFFAALAGRPVRWN